MPLEMSKRIGYNCFTFLRRIGRSFGASTAEELPSGHVLNINSNNMLSNLTAGLQVALYARVSKEQREGRTIALQVSRAGAVRGFEWRLTKVYLDVDGT